MPVGDTATEPASQQGISTVKARIFYPTSASKKSKGKPVWWLPEPQFESLAAYGRFLGARPGVARAISYFTSFVKRTKIPAISEAPLLEPQYESSRWPVAIFSHGLGGSFNAYSYLCGTLASCGVVVFAIEHRDGSCPISFITSEDGSVTSVDYKRLPHEPTPEILEARNEQLSIRFAELDVLYSTIVNLNEGECVENLVERRALESRSFLKSLTSRLDLRPSKVIWMGHSFGAATITQLLKSVYWSRSISETESSVALPNVLYTPAANGKLDEQVTAKSPVVLLDLWTMPLGGEKSQWLYEKPLPSLADENPTTTTVLSIMSEEFFNYSDLRERTIFVLSGRPSRTGVELNETRDRSDHGPRLFYVKESAHLNQSDFGILFPWLTKRFTGAAEPERIMNLNMRAILQLLRQNGIPVRPIAHIGEETTSAAGIGKGGHDDQDILSPDRAIRNWTAIPLHVGHDR